MPSRSHVLQALGGVVHALAHLDARHRRLSNLSPGRARPAAGQRPASVVLLAALAPLLELRREASGELRRPVAVLTAMSVGVDDANPLTAIVSSPDARSGGAGCDRGLAKARVVRWMGSLSKAGGTGLPMVSIERSTCFWSIAMVSGEKMIWSTPMASTGAGRDDLLGRAAHSASPRSRRSFSACGVGAGIGSGPVAGTPGRRGSSRATGRRARRSARSRPATAASAPRRRRAGKCWSSRRCCR